MTDVHTAEQRSRNMSAIKNKNTRAEYAVRKYIHKQGFRYTLHDKKYFGKPDVVLSRYKKMIFIHGCFWHMHSCRFGKVVPKTNGIFWRNKRLGNRNRDRVSLAKLKKLGWNVLVIWECQVKQPIKLEKILNQFLYN